MPKDDEAHSHDDGRERLQKVLASAGVASRRECEQLILDGRVEVDRQVVTELGTRVDPLKQEIRVDGEVLRRPKLVYFAINKPVGVITTARDPAGRPRVTDLMPPNAPRVFPVGRLDIASEGLILVTNDGELANGLTHPRHGVEKIYQVQVAGQVERDVLAQLHRGIHLAEGFAHAKHVRIKGRRKKSTILEMVLDEGRNREVRRLLARVGHKVQRLKRIAVGPVRLGELPAGAVRPLSREEVQALEKAVTRGSREEPRRDERPRPSKSKENKKTHHGGHRGRGGDKSGRTIIG
jgi:23S rRNA pseudouridine2605 synthase